VARNGRLIRYTGQPVVLIGAVAFYSQFIRKVKKDE
jgi:hypothetical protein